MYLILNRSLFQKKNYIKNYFKLVIVVVKILCKEPSENTNNY